MALRRRLAPLPDDRQVAWQAFQDCAAVIEAGRLTLLATLPVGRVEPTPIGLGVDAMAQALEDAADWMPGWQLDELADDWAACGEAMAEAAGGLETIREVAATTSELEDLQMAVLDVVEPLDVFGDAERAWRRTWKVPRAARP